VSRTHARKGSARARTSRRPATLDGGVYIGLLMIGLFGIWLWTILVPGEDPWKAALLGYVIAVLGFVNFFAWRACSGVHLAGWQQSLARLVLRWAGYGTVGGRPLEAARGSQRARMVLLVGVSASAIAIAALTWLLYRA
jgi:hypothetical protein